MITVHAFTQEIPNVMLHDLCIRSHIIPTAPVTLGLRPCHDQAMTEKCWNHEQIIERAQLVAEVMGDRKSKINCN